jgi:hypothetical protein
MRRIVTLSDGTVMLHPRRISAGAAALIFFAIFFALPLYAAATMCSMPCCHHSTPGAKLKSDLPACPSSECLTAADETTVKAVSRYVAPSRAGLDEPDGERRFDASPRAVAVTRRTRPPAAPLQLPDLIRSPALLSRRYGRRPLSCFFTSFLR